MAVLMSAKKGCRLCRKDGLRDIGGAMVITALYVEAQNVLGC